MIRTLYSNISPRLRLLKTALTRRFIWLDLTIMVKEHGHEIREIRANIQPFSFVSDFRNTSEPAPEFRKILGSLQEFERYDAYPWWNSEPSVSEFLGELVFRHRARTVVEVGCFVGWSSAHIALGLKAAGAVGRLWCIDCNSVFLDAARTNLARLQLDDLTYYICGGSLEETVLAALPSKVDVIFLDTSHEYDDTLREIEVYSRRLSEDGFLVLHDSISANGVRRAIKKVYPSFKCMTFATEDGNGVTVLRKFNLNTTMVA
jgi:predicted O-methyltransferase YrrM